MKRVKDILKVLFYTLAILTMAVSLFGRAGAYGADNQIPDQVDNQIVDMVKDSLSDAQFDLFVNALNDSSYQSVNFCYTPLDYSESINAEYGFVVQYSSLPTCYLSCNSLSLPTYNFTVSVVGSPNSILESSSCLYLVVSLSNSSHTFCCYSSYDRINSSVSFGSDSFYYGSWNYSKRNILFGSIPNSGSIYLAYRYSYSSEDSYAYGSVIQPSYRFDFVPFELNSFDSFISVYKTLDNNGFPVLNVTWTKTPFPTSGSFNYAGYTNVDITFEVDGSSRVVSINTDDYPELFSNYSDGQFYIPYSVFQKVANLVSDYGDAAEVSVTQVDISMMGYPAGSSSSAAQSYSMSTLVSPPLVFKGQDDSIPNFDYDDVSKASEVTPTEVYTPTEINYYIQKFSSSYGAGQWLYSSSDLQVPDNMDVLYLTLYGRENWFNGNYVDDRLLELNSFNLSYDEDFDVDGLIRYVLANLSDFVNGNFSIYELVSNNLFSSDYDIIALQLYSFDSNLNKTKMGNLYFYTHRYYLSLLNRQMVGLTELAGISNDYLYSTYDFLYTRLNGMTSNMNAYFDSDLNKQNSIIAYLGSVNTGLNTLNSNFVNLTGTTHGYLNNILSAIGNIDTGGSTDLTGVLNKLDTISGYVADLPNAIRADLIYLFKPSYDDIDVNYQSYHDSIGILALPFDTCKLVLDTVDDNYSSKLSIDVPEIKFMNTKLYDGTLYEVDPFVYFDDQVLSEEDDPTGQGFVKGLRYFIAFLAILGSVYGTYCHIFRRKEVEE